jgi:hypothetical protein
MGLSVTVAPLAAAIAERNVDAQKALRRDLGRINRLLSKQSLPQHDEPETIVETPDFSPLIGHPYSWLHRLRRVLAYVRAGQRATPIDSQANPAEDPLLRREYANKRNDSHLIRHSDCSGYYVPVDFQSPLLGTFLTEPPGGPVGSTQRLRGDLRAVAPVLGIDMIHEELPEDVRERMLDELEENADDPFFEERQVWLVLYIAAGESLSHRASLRFE